MAKRRLDLYWRFFLIYFGCYFCTKILIPETNARAAFLNNINYTKPCRLQMYPKLGREPRLAKSEIGSNQQEELLITLNANNGSICTKLSGGLSILVIYKKSNVSKKIDGYIFSRIVPNNARVASNCDQEDASFVNISWNEYSLVWNFAKTPGRKRWYVNQIDLVINTRTEGFRKFAFCGKSFTFSTMEPIFPTPLGYSYRTFNKTAIYLRLTDGRDVSPTANFTAKLYLTENFQMQPFMNAGIHFGPVFDLENEIYAALGINRSPTVEISENSSNYYIDEMLYNETSASTTTTSVDLNETTSTATTMQPGVVVYSLHDSGPYKCIELKTDGLIEINFKSENGDDGRVETDMPSIPIVEGSCLTNEAWMRISWDGYVMKWCFVQEEGVGWWVTHIEVIICTTNRMFENIFVNEEPIKLTKNKERLIHNRSGCAFEAEELVVNLTSHQEAYARYEFFGVVALRNFQLAAFMVHDN